MLVRTVAGTQFLKMIITNMIHLGHSIQSDTLQKMPTNLVKVTVDSNQPSVTIESNWYFLGFLILIFIIWLLIGRNLKNKIGGKYFVSKVKMKVKAGNVEFEEEISRSFQNIQVANRIYIELVTRKAAIPLDEDHDVIKEVYDSWYALFGIIRNEIKNVPGEFLKNHKDTDKLIELTTEILNKGLRPHLTKHQARFRKWYQEQLEEIKNKGKNPQDIQKGYPEYASLANDLREVNKILISYSQELIKLIKGGG